MLLSNCVVCNSKKSKFIKEQEASRLLSSLASRLLSSLRIKTPLNKIPALDPLLF